MTDHKVSKEYATQLFIRYHKYQKEPDEASLFNFDNIEQIRELINNNNAKSFRIFNGLDEDDKVVPVLSIITKDDEEIGYLSNSQFIK